MIPQTNLMVPDASPFRQWNQARRAFGGLLLKNSHAKERRPLGARTPLHLVMRSDLAKGSRALLLKERPIQKIAYRLARRTGVRIYRLAIAEKHVNLVILPRNRRAFARFIRGLSGLIARIVLRAERGSPKGVRFWDQRPFSRIIQWGREYALVCETLFQSDQKATGFLPYRPTLGKVRLETG